MDNEEYQSEDVRENNTNRRDDYSSERGGERSGGSDYNRDNQGGGYQRGGYHRDGGQRNDYNRDNQGGGYQRGGYHRDGGQRNDYNRDNQGGGYQRGGYNRDGGQRNDYNRDNQGGGYKRGGYNRDGGQRNDYNRDNQGGGYNRGGYNRDGGQRNDYNRDNQGGGGYRREAERAPQEAYKPRPRPKPIFLKDSQFLLPDHDLNQEFQRAIGMTKGTITEVDPRKKRGTIEIDGHPYKFEDERKRDYQRKYPIEKFKDREIQFAFWPTYSQKAAQYRKIDESPTIKIANLRRTLPEANFVEIIGEVMTVNEALFVLSIFSKSQKKKYLVTILGEIDVEVGSLIQMFGKLVEGGIHYNAHRLVPVGDEAIAARKEAKAKVETTPSA